MFPFLPHQIAQVGTSQGFSAMALDVIEPTFPPNTRVVFEVLEHCLEIFGTRRRANKWRLNPGEKGVLLVQKSTRLIVMLSKMGCTCS